LAHRRCWGVGWHRRKLCLSTEAWSVLHEEDFGVLGRDVAGLPSELVDEDEDARRFDLLMLRLQLSLLRGDPGFEQWRDQVRAIAALLEEKSSIPMVREQMLLIQEIQSEAWWDDVTTPMLETARKRLRLLVQLIEKAKRQPIYTDFEDQLGNETPVELPGFGVGADFERFRAKARQFLRQHENHLTIHKLRWNMPLTPVDLGELERMLVEAGVGTSADLSRAKQESSGLGLSFAHSSAWTARRRSRRLANSCQGRCGRRIRSNSSTSSSTI
jgi:type I restriction enzyme R subunit